jgi:hypothetical protein
MNIKYLRAYLMVCSLVVVLQPLRGLAQHNSDASKTSAQLAPAERAGQHDFDPLIGAWKYHLKRRLHPLRFVWTNMTTSTPHFEQSFSDDGGITDQTRVPDESDKRTEL